MTPVRSARSPAVFMGAMTVLWSVLSLRAVPVVGAVLAVAGAGVMVSAVALARGRGRADAAATTGPGSSGRTGRPRAGGASRSVFRTAVAAEIVAALIAVVSLNRTGHSQYIAPAIALIVALHFFVFLLDGPQPMHVATGTVAAGTAIGLIAAGVVTPGTGQAIAGGALALCTLGYGLGFLRILADSHRSTTDPGTARN
ncbi:hypothetical protein [Tsukamurella paurometabola]|uniref:Integral membrane protein n=1 Tax=Tsukamurella paurometabola TaxID=2061 RepID=A0ABS5NJ45_TSUPA|nr:hypothetical protein [Tsukamurella paurometabola]MBS4104311.1 hypothetical protein [Tsukamurella paurometabola]